MFQAKCEVGRNFRSDLLCSRFVEVQRTTTLSSNYSTLQLAQVAAAQLIADIPKPLNQIPAVHALKTG